MVHPYSPIQSQNDTATPPASATSPQIIGETQTSRRSRTMSAISNAPTPSPAAASIKSGFSSISNGLPSFRTTCVIPAVTPLIPPAATNSSATLLLCPRPCGRKNRDSPSTNANVPLFTCWARSTPYNPIFTLDPDKPLPPPAQQNKLASQRTSFRTHSTWKPQSLIKATNTTGRPAVNASLISACASQSALAPKTEVMRTNSSSLGRAA